MLCDKQKECKPCENDCSRCPNDCDPCPTQTCPPPTTCDKCEKPKPCLPRVVYKHVVKECSCPSSLDSAVTSCDPCPVTEPPRPCDPGSSPNTDPHTYEDNNSLAKDLDCSACWMTDFMTESTLLDAQTKSKIEDKKETYVFHNFIKGKNTPFFSFIIIDRPLRGLAKWTGISF